MKYLALHVFVIFEKAAKFETEIEGGALWVKVSSPVTIYLHRTS